MSSSSDDDENEDYEDYEVEAIVAHRFTKGKLEYRIRWVGYAPSADTWQTEDTLDGCQELLTEYKAQNPDTCAPLRRTSRETANTPKLSLEPRRWSTRLKQEKVAEPQATTSAVESNPPLRKRGRPPKSKSDDTPKIDGPSFSCHPSTSHSRSATPQTVPKKPDAKISRNEALARTAIQNFLARRDGGKAPRSMFERGLQPKEIDSLLSYNGQKLAIVRFEAGRNAKPELELVPLVELTNNFRALYIKYLENRYRNGLPRRTGDRNDAERRGLSSASNSGLGNERDTMEHAQQLVATLPQLF